MLSSQHNLPREVREDRRKALPCGPLPSDAHLQAQTAQERPPANSQKNPESLAKVHFEHDGLQFLGQTLHVLHQEGLRRADPSVHLLVQWHLCNLSLHRKEQQVARICDEYFP